MNLLARQALWRYHRAVRCRPNRGADGVREITSMDIPTRVLHSLLPAAVLALLVVGNSTALRAAIQKEEARQMSAAPAPYCLATHNVGRFVVGITNFGRIGIGRNVGPARIDCFTRLLAPLGEYPKGSNTTYLYKGALWIGGIRDGDTLVSTGNDFNNQSQEMHPVLDMIRASTLENDWGTPFDAVSEQDYVALYVDTFRYGVPNPTFDPLDGRPHKPLGLEISQHSYAWSHGHADDFIIIEYDICNIGPEQLTDVYVGIYWDGDVHVGQRNVRISQDPWGRKGVTDGNDDLSGLVYWAPAEQGNCTFRDTVVLAWTADNDGDPLGSDLRVPNVAGIRILSAALKSNRRISFNWWTYNYNPKYDFGPQHRKRFRYMGNGTGTPYGDRRKYHLLSNGEIDYDQARTLEIGEFDPLWMYPGFYNAARFSRGTDVQYLLSIGPYTMPPGASVTIPIAMVAGEGLHTDYTNYNANLRGKYHPDVFYDNLDFSHLIRNALTADMVYDIPGVDTDGDGYCGKYRVCVLDSLFIDSQWVSSQVETTFYQGDGVPDLLASEAPPAPELWITPVLNGFRIRFNGARSETTRDVFSGKVDFEGYRVYIARDDREASFSVVAQYDRENYDKFVYVTRKGTNPSFKRHDEPFTLAELRCLYAFNSDPCSDSTFDPLFFLPDRPYIHPDFPDSVFYFDVHDYNASIFGVKTPICKIYPDQPPPSSLDNPNPEELTEDGRLKYYEYEYTIENLLPNVPYYIAVTAFDIGSPEADLEPLESSKTLYAKRAYPNNQWDEAPDGVGNVYVFPNPYRDDANYRKLGFEGRGQEDRMRDRVRKLTFANLPAKCTISIFSLDGDLIKRIDHDYDPSDPNSSYHEWDLVTRNIQMIVSGLYYWTVEDDQGQVQIGKLVVLF
ncbi:MAG: hypothetical protein AB1744_02190 [Candidatus Zixiibacteriota bacterium]